MVLVPLAWYPVMLAGTAFAVQVKVVLAMFEVNVTAVVLSPVQMLCCIEAFVTMGAGSTLMV